MNKKISLGLALLAFLAQMALGLGFSAREGLEQKWLSLRAWDSLWYLEISEKGYSSDIPPKRWEYKTNNVCFFPGYSWTTRIVGTYTPLNMQQAQLVTAQFFTLVFWFFFFEIAALLGMTLGTKIIAGLGFLSYPASFFWITAYSESLYTASALGFLYWGLSRSRRSSFWKAAASGFVMTLTRINGVVFSPVFIAEKLLFDRSRKIWSELALGFLSLLGMITFFIFCQVQWGYWNLYFWTKFEGWGLKTDWSAFIDGQVWNPLRQEWWNLGNYLDPIKFSQWLTPLFSWICMLGIGLFIYFWKSERGSFRHRLRFLLLFSFVGLHFLSVLSIFPAQFIGMVRHEAPTFALLSLYFTSYLPQFQRTKKLIWGLFLVLFLALIFMMNFVQAEYIRLFSIHHWVA